MNKKQLSLLTVTVAVILCMIMAAPAAAQQQSRQQAGPSYQLEPVGWVRVAYDLNNDNVYDTFEYISYYDLERARRSSQQRMREEQGRRGRTGQQQFRQQQDRRGQMGRQFRQSRSGQRQMSQRQQQRRPRFDTLEGTIREMKTINLTRFEDPHVVARVQTRQGRTGKADLGPKKKIDELNLQKGDRIKVYGKTGTINEKSMLMANLIQTGNNQRITIRRPQDKNLKFYSGEVLKTRTASFKKTQGGNNLMARMRLDNGAVTIVNLGPEKDLENSNIKSGQNVAMLARPVNINGRRALVAEQLLIGNQLVDIDWAIAKRQKS